MIYVAAVETPEYEDVSVEFVIEDVDADYVDGAAGDDESVVDLSDVEVIAVSSGDSCLCNEYCVDHDAIDSAEV